MKPWLKFYETITKPLSLFLAVSTGFILFAPKSMIVKLGMARVIADYRWVIGLGFVIATTWLAGFIIDWSAEIDRRLNESTAREIARERGELDE
ncbi:MAG: super-infection exclusion protein B [Candidatus Acidiferrales bacterium]